MTSSRKLSIRPFTESDCGPIAGLLQESDPDYLRHFRPFAYETSAISALVSQAVLDQWFVLEVEAPGSAQPAGFYMLRGMDEGFTEPMYGVFVAQQFAGSGLGRLTLAHAETQCRLNGWKTLLLKVNPDNLRAWRLYESSGFRFLRTDAKHGEQVLAKTFSS